MSTLSTETSSLHFLLIDSHEIVLEGFVPLLRSQYPQSQITIAKNTADATEIANNQFVHLIITDISLPPAANCPASIEVGIQLIEALMTGTHHPNIMVFSANVRPLFRLQEMANSYPAGFVAVDKAASVQTLLDSVGIALEGSIYLPPEVRLQADFASSWIRLLGLKYHEALSDRAIARTMGLSDRTIRNYWSRIQDAFNIYDNPDKDVRIQIQLAARQAGLIH